VDFHKSEKLPTSDSKSTIVTSPKPGTEDWSMVVDTQASNEDDSFSFNTSNSFQTGMLHHLLKKKKMGFLSHL